MKGIFSALIGLLLCTSLCAAEIVDAQPKLILHQVKTIKAGEYLGDDLYFDISVSRASHPSKYFRIPEYPMTVSSKLTEKLKSLTLWSESVKKDESVSITVSLVDQDLNILNPDDLIGSVRLKLNNKDGQLQAHWTIPNQDTAPVEVLWGQIQKFHLKNSDGNYELYLSLTK